MIDHKILRKEIPRLPLDGSLDLTYRCNNNCRHCWLRIPAHSQEKNRELTLEELKQIADEARQMGCRTWHISGGEPMLRPDFMEIFDYLTSRSIFYSLNTNGTLITPQIARLMTRKGSKMVALYGATAEVHDHVTRQAGSFAATMQAFAYLKEAGASFIVQIIPIRANFHQYEEMVKLAQSLSPHYRIGAPWLFLSACGSAQRNAEIRRQRLDPKEVILLDQPDLGYEDWATAESECTCQAEVAEDRLLSRCISERREFHIDPYGKLGLCCFIKDPGLRYDLRSGSFQEAWDRFLPALADHVRGGREYLENCGACELRPHCRWCDVYSYLEHRRHGAKVQYLCQVARENRTFKDDWQSRHRRYYQIAGITVLVESDLPITDETFSSKFQEFRCKGPGDDLISIRHHFSLPDLKGKDLGVEVYRRPPWAIYRKGRTWIYLGIAPDADDPNLHQVAVFNHDHTRGQIFHPGDHLFRQGGLQALTHMVTDQIWLGQVLANRQGAFLHSSGVIIAGQGLLFVGHSEAGKSTMVKMLQGKAEILCDDRNIIRRWPEGFRVHGTWSHGEVPLVSAASAPLRAILFLRQSSQNRLVPLKNPREILGRLLGCLIKPLVTANWWDQMLNLMEAVVREVTCYELEFDQSGRIVADLEALVQEKP